MTALTELLRSRREVLLSQGHPIKGEPRSIKYAYALGVALVAQSDGKICFEEAEYLKNLTTRLDLPESDFSQIVELVSVCPQELIDKVVISLREGEWGLFFLFDIQSIAGKDGDFSEDEKDTLNLFAELLKILPSERDRVLELGTDSSMDYGQVMIAIGRLLLENPAHRPNGKEQAEHWFKKAMIWSETAAKSGYLPAYRYMGELYIEGLGVKEDRKEALGFWTLVAEAGDPEAMMTAGELEEDGNRAIEWYKKAAASGKPEALFKIGEILENSEERQEALTFYRNALLQCQGLETLKWVLEEDKIKDTDISSDPMEGKLPLRQAIARSNALHSAGISSGLIDTYLETLDEYIEGLLAVIREYASAKGFLKKVVRWSLRIGGAIISAIWAGNLWGSAESWLGKTGSVFLWLICLGCIAESFSERKRGKIWKEAKTAQKESLLNAVFARS